MSARDDRCQRERDTGGCERDRGGLKRAMKKDVQASTIACNDTKPACRRATSPERRVGMVRHIVRHIVRHGMVGGRHE